MKRTRGAALIAVIFVIVVMSLLAGITAFLVVGSSASALEYQSSEQALFIGEAGVERAARALTAQVFTPGNADRRRVCSVLVNDPELTNIALGMGLWNLTAAGATYSSNTAAPGTGARLSAALSATATTLPVNDTAGYAAAGRLMVDREVMDYSAVTATAFTGLVRGAAGTAATAHANTARVGQYQCDIVVQGAVANFASPRGLRTLSAGVQLQEGWAVGDNGVLLRWNSPADAPPGGVPRWTLFGATTRRLNAVSMDSYANGWAVGDTLATGARPAQTRRWNPDGTPAWDLVDPNAANDGRLNAVHALSNNEAWTVGDDRPNLLKAMSLRFNGSQWVEEDSFVDRNLLGVSMLDGDGDGIADDGWAVGQRQANNFLFLRWNSPLADQWNVTPLASANRENLNGVFMLSAQDGWAVGRERNGRFTFVRWNNPNANVWNVWSFPHPDADHLNGVFMQSNLDGWAVGDGGAILRWNNPVAGAWSVVAAPGAITGENLRAVSCVTPTECWSVGDNGTILYWNGAVWSEHAQSGVVTGENLRGLSLVGPRVQPRTAWREVFP